MNSYFTILQKIVNSKTLIYPKFKKKFDLDNNIWSNYYANEDKSNKYLYHIYAFMNYIEQTPDNEKDLRDLPKNITEKLKIHPVKFVDELFTIALKSKPTRLKPRQKKPLGRKDVSNDITKNLQ